MAGVLIQAGLFAAAVALGLWSARRARLATIPLLLGFGIAVGDAGLGLLPDDALLRDATELGLVLMLFYTSLAGNPAAVRQGGRVGLPLAAYDLVLNFGIAWWIGAHFGWNTEETLVLAGVLSASSTAVVLKILGDEGRITRREGNVLVSLLLIEDWVFLGFFAFLGLRYGDPVHVDAVVRVVAFVGFAAFLCALRLVRHAVWRIEAREVLVGVLTAAGLLGAFLGTLGGLPAVGAAFTTGLVLAGERGARFVQSDAPYLRDGASALFFVGYGALLGPVLSVDLLPLVAWCVGGVLVAELLFLPVLAHRLGLSRREGFLLGALLVPRGGKSAAFARLAGSGSPLFGLSGILALVLTPLAPLLARVVLGWPRPAWRPWARAPDAFSRSARNLLLPHAYRQRWSWTWPQRIVLAELLLLPALLGLFALLVPFVWRIGPVVLAGACLALLWRLAGPLLARSPAFRAGSYGEVLGIHDDRSPALLLLGPTAILLALAVTAAWAEAAYPVILGVAMLIASVLPWVRRARRGARLVGRGRPSGRVVAHGGGRLVKPSGSGATYARLV